MNQENNNPQPRRVDPSLHKSGSTTTKDVNEQVMANTTSTSAKSNTVSVYPLTNTMIEDVFVFIDIYVVKHEVAIDDLEEYFAPHSDSFAEFFLAVERHFKWFDYTQAEYVIEILDIYFQKAWEEYDLEH